MFIMFLINNAQIPFYLKYLINLFIQTLIYKYYMAGTVQGNEDMIMKKLNNFCPQRAVVQ